MSDIVVNQDPFTVPICANCKHLIAPYKCKAFDHIPKDITFGRNDHSKVIEGQKGDFIFTPKK